MKRLFYISVFAVLMCASSAFAQSPQFITKWGSFGTAPGQFNEAFNIEVEADGHVLVIDQKGQRVERFTQDGTYVNEFSTVSVGKVEDIVVDASGNIYLTSRINGAGVAKFSASGSFLSSIGSRGVDCALPSFFCITTGIAFDSNGNMYVADAASMRIQKFDAAGNWVSQWGSNGTGNGQFNYIFALAIDHQDHVYATDLYNSRVQKFSTDGTFLGAWGSPGSGTGQFTGPSGIAVDQNNHVYVVDADNARIQIFDENGGYLGQWGSVGAGDGHFNHPVGIAIDSQGNVYVSDWWNNEVQKFGYLATPTAKTSWGHLKSLYR